GVGNANADDAQKAARFEIHSVLKQANYDLVRQQFNTVASAAMKILNALERLSGVNDETVREGLSILLRLLSPITPHVTHQLWRDLGYGDDILNALWPEADEAALQQDEIELVLQINGKKRGSVRVPSGADKAAIEKITLADPAVLKLLDGKPAKKVVPV